MLVHHQSGQACYIDDYRYSAPEILWRDDDSMGRILIRQESDVYGMGMVAYEASRHLPVLPDPRDKSHIDPLGLDRERALLWM